MRLIVRPRSISHCPPVNAVLPGRRLNPPEPVFAPNRQSITRKLELFMELISSLLKSPDDRGEPKGH